MTGKPPTPPGKGHNDDEQKLHSPPQQQQEQGQEYELGVLQQFSQFNFFPRALPDSQAKVTFSPSIAIPSSNISKPSGTGLNSSATAESEDSDGIQAAGPGSGSGTSASHFHDWFQPAAAAPSSSLSTPQQPHNHDVIASAPTPSTSRDEGKESTTNTTSSFSSTPISSPAHGQGQGQGQGRGSVLGLGFTLSPSLASKKAAESGGNGGMTVSVSPLPHHRFQKKGSTCTVTTASTSRSGEDDDDDDNNNNGMMRSWNEAEEKKLVKKLDWCFLPTVWLMALMSWMDRSSIGNAQLAGMGQDLGLSSGQYSMVIVVFYFGYVSCGPLSNLILSRTRPRLYLPCLVGCWGVLTLCMAFVEDYIGLLVLRFLVGVFESGLSPATIFLISCWYRPEEQGKRISATLSAALLGGAFGGIIAGSAAAWLEGVRNIRGWRWLFGFEGVFTLIWATISFWLMIDFPGSESTARKFGKRGKQIAVGRVKKAGILLGSLDADRSLTAAVERLGKLKSITVALGDWRVWTITIGVGLLGCSTVLAYFYPILIYDMGYHSVTQSQFMTIPIWTSAVVFAVGMGFVADRYPHHRAFMMAVWMGVAAAFSIVVCLVHASVTRYVLLIFMAGGIWSSIALYLSLLTVTFSDMNPEARAFALALPGAVGNMGNMYGAYLFPVSDMPDYRMGFGVIAGTLTAGAVLFLAVHILLRRRRMLRMYE